MCLEPLNCEREYSLSINRTSRANVKEAEIEENAFSKPSHETAAKTDSETGQQ